MMLRPRRSSLLVINRSDKPLYLMPGEILLGGQRIVGTSLNRGIVFQEHRLPNGTWEIAGKRVAPEDIKNTALLTIEGELDDISGNGQTEAAHDLCRGIPKAKRRHFLAKGAGHYGIFSGRRWRELIYPEIRQFIRSNA